MTKTFSVDEVALHNNSKDLWMIIHGGIYNITKFLQEHPGGEEVLINLAGKDGTQCFDEIGHTSEAIQLRETFKIGVLGEDQGHTDNTTVSEEMYAEKQTLTVNNETFIYNDDDDDVNANWKDQESKSETSSNLLSAFIGVLAVIYAIVFYSWYL